MILNESNSIIRGSSYEHYSGYSTIFLGTIGGIQIVMLGIIIFLLFLQQRQLSRLEIKVMHATGRKNENGTPSGLEEGKLLQS